MQPRLQPPRGLLVQIHERRRSPRVQVPHQLLAWTQTGMPIRILDISAGGCLLESEAPFPAQSPQLCEFRTLDGSVRLMITVRVTYSRSVGAPAGRIMFLTGLEFVTTHSSANPAEFDRLLDAVSAVAAATDRAC